MKLFLIAVVAVASFALFIGQAASEGEDQVGSGSGSEVAGSGSGGNAGGGQGNKSVVVDFPSFDSIDIRIQIQ